MKPAGKANPAVPQGHISPDSHISAVLSHDSQLHAAPPSLTDTALGWEVQCWTWRGHSSVMTVPAQGQCAGMVLMCRMRNRMGIRKQNPEISELIGLLLAISICIEKAGVFSQSLPTQGIFPISFSFHAVGSGAVREDTLIENQITWK